MWDLEIHIGWKRWFLEMHQILIGFGWENISFLNYVWVGTSPLMVTCPNIYRLALDQHTSVAKCYDENRKIWVPRLRRDPNDWEVGELLNLLEILCNLNPNNERSDRWIWKFNRKGQFTSKSIYTELSKILRIWFPHKGIWVPFIPFRIAFFI